MSRTCSASRPKSPQSPVAIFVSHRLSQVNILCQHGHSISPGSAYQFESLEPTPVQLAMGLSEADAVCAVRISLAHDTTVEDIRLTAIALAQVLEGVETTVRFLPCK